jgi:hypothetical protein
MRAIKLFLKGCTVLLFFCARVVEKGCAQKTIENQHRAQQTKREKNLIVSVPLL